MTTLLAGCPASNDTLYHAIRFSAGDPAGLIDTGSERLLIIRDIEMDRARAHARADRVACPADFEPEGGLSGDRETAVAQSIAEALVRAGVDRVRSDRTLALSYVAALEHRGIAIDYDPDLGVMERRAKDDDELAALREAQNATQDAIERACRLVASSEASGDGRLLIDGEPLTSERVRTVIDGHLLEMGYDNPTSIVAGGLHGADCHEHGHGQLFTEQPVIIDVFPRSKATRYNGDCTRTVVHGEPPPVVQRMHAAVLEAKAAGEKAARSAATGQAVHEATIAVIESHGFEVGLPGDDAPHDRIAMVHGTGHGLGLQVHEPPLLDVGGPPLVTGDVVTIEPGLYGPSIGGLRVEDMVVVGEHACEDLGQGLHMGLDWT